MQKGQQHQQPAGCVIAQAQIALAAHRRGIAMQKCPELLQRKINRKKTKLCFTEDV